MLFYSLNSPGNYKVGLAMEIISLPSLLPCCFVRVASIVILLFLL